MLAYHVTYSDLADAIALEGLRDSLDGVYLCTDADEALTMMGWRRQHRPDFVWLEEANRRLHSGKDPRVVLEDLGEPNSTTFDSVLLVTVEIDEASVVPSPEAVGHTAIVHLGPISSERIVALETRSLGDIYSAGPSTTLPG